MRTLVMTTLALLTCATARAERIDPFSVRKPLTAVEAPAPVVKPDEPLVLDPGKSRRRAGTLTAVAGTTLIAGSATVSYVMKQRYERYAENGRVRPDFPGSLYEATVEANRAQQLARVWGTGLFLAGAATIGAGAYLYFTAPMKVRLERVIVPVVGDDSVGVAASGRF
jgi:hypothetical protein